MSRPSTSRLFRLLAVSGLFVCLGTAICFGSPIEASAPIKRFTLPVFSPEGHRTMHLKGDEAILQGTNQLNIQGMTLSIYEGKTGNKLETLLTSVKASFFPNEKRAEGDQGVRIRRDDVDMTGTRWNYDHVAKKVVIDGKVRVIFSAQIVDILQ